MLFFLSALRTRQIRVDPHCVNAAAITGVLVINATPVLWFRRLWGRITGLQVACRSFNTSLL